MHKRVRRFLANNRLRIEATQRLLEEPSEEVPSDFAAFALTTFKNAQVVVLDAMNAKTK